MYTRVIVQSVKTTPEETAIVVILEAFGDGEAPVTDNVVIDGARFEPSLLRDAARTLLARLNTRLATLAAVRALVGTEVTV